MKGALPQLVLSHHAAFRSCRVLLYDLARYGETWREMMFVMERIDYLRVRNQRSREIKKGELSAGILVT